MGPAAAVAVVAVVAAGASAGVAAKSASEAKRASKEQRRQQQSLLDIFPPEDDPKSQQAISEAEKEVRRRLGAGRQSTILSRNILSPVAPAKTTKTLLGD